jgi:CRISPR-associated endonuclease Cas1
MPDLNVAQEPRNGTTGLPLPPGRESVSPWHPSLDVTAWEQATRDSRILVADGDQVRVTVRDGQLSMEDGVPGNRRTRKLPRVAPEYSRLVILGGHGYVTLEAQRWMDAANLPWCVIDTYSGDRLVAVSGPSETGVTDARLLRRQVMAATETTGLEIARELLTRKVHGHAAILSDVFSDLNMAAVLYAYAGRMQTAESISQDRESQTVGVSLSELEGWAARDYFAAWQGRIAARWDDKSLQRVPVNWLAFPGRRSLVSGGTRKQNATDPVNALLNFTYTLGYSVCRTACIAHGLDPRLGYVHTDKPGRDSLALDVLETVRPDIDRYILGLLTGRTFIRHDFSETTGHDDIPPGTCRVNPPLTHEIAARSADWRVPAESAVRAVLGILTGHAGKRGDHTHNLLRDRQQFQAVTVTADDILPDKLWRVFVPLIPEWPRKTFRPPIPDRTIIAAMVHMTRSRRPWAHVPPSLGVSFRTMTDRRRMWQRSGHWPEIQETIESIAREH